MMNLPDKGTGNTRQPGKSDEMEIDGHESNSDFISARVERARVAYRPANKRSKVAAAEREKRFAAEIGGTVCEWDVPFDVRCGKNVIDLKTIQKNQ